MRISSENLLKKWEEMKGKQSRRKLFPIAAGLTVLLSALIFVACRQATEESTENPEGDGGSKTANVVNVYNWGEYIDPEVISMFEEETGIKVVYDMFETNEEMYPVIEAGGVLYDAVCPSDYMIEKLKGEILMQDSVRDAFMVALKKEGHSMNTVDEKQLDEAMADLIAQKPLVQAYVVDQVRDKMIGEEAAVGVIYSGEILYVQGELEGTDVEVEYVIPEEGTNLWVDGWVIPKNAKHKENAEKWINFLCRPDIAAKNFEYITYTTPNEGALALLDPEYTENKAVFPDMEEVLKKGEVFSYLGEKDEAKYNDRWKKIKVS